MKKLFYLLLLLPLLFNSCGSDNNEENFTPPIKNYKYQYVIYNDERKEGIYNITLHNQDAYGKLVDSNEIESIKYGKKSDTIYTNGCQIFFLYHYTVNGKEKSGLRSKIFIKENKANVIGIFGYNDERNTKN